MMEFKECGYKNHVGDRLLPAEMFYKAPNKTGLSYACKVCSKQYANTSGKAYREKHSKHLAAESKRWREENRDHWLQLKRESYAKNRDEYLRYGREYYYRNRDSMIEYAIRYREANGVSVKEYMKQWRQENKDKCREYCMMRYAAIRQAVPPWYHQERDDIVKLYAQAREKTEQTGVLYEVDHIVPLRGKTVSGLHCLANLQILTKEENNKKKNKFTVG